jgi:hypothetical protein
MSEHHRAAERLDLSGSLVGEVMVYQPTTIRQVSEGGMQVETLFPLQLDSLHTFRLTLGDRSVVVKGRVVHSHVTEFEHDGVVYCSGIEFIELSEPVAEVIGSFIRELRDVRSGIQRPRP